MTQDNRYIDALRTKDANTIKEIYTTYFPKIRKYVVSNAGNEPEASDIFQEAMVILFQQVTEEGLEIKSSFYNYLFTICRNLWMRKLSKLKHQASVSIDEINSEELGVEEADQMIEQREQFELFQEKFKKLSPSCQQVLGLYFAGKSMEEIAKDQGFSSAGYSKKRKHNCQKHLIASIKEDVRYKILKL